MYSPQFCLFSGGMTKFGILGDFLADRYLHRAKDMGRGQLWPAHMRGIYRFRQFHLCIAVPRCSTRVRSSLVSAVKQPVSGKVANRLQTEISEQH